MNYFFLNSYAFLSAVIVGFTLLAARRLFRGDKMAKCLAVSCVVACGCVFSYFARVLTDSIDVFAWMTSIHLICVDLALLFYFRFITYYTKVSNGKGTKAVLTFLNLVMFIDIVALLVNPFKNIVLEFSFRYPEPLYTKIVYAAQHPLYYMHMGLAYVIIIGILYLLGRRISSIPKEFRRQYTYTTFALTVVLFLNFGSVFVLGNKSYLNYSVSAYCLMGIIMYVFAYKFSNYIMLNYFKESVFENVNQGIVLFDYNGDMVMRNTRAARMLSTVVFDSALNRTKFEHDCNIVLETEKKLDAVSLQCNMVLASGTVPFRCDFRKLRNETGALLGYLYVFADIGLETDLLTGFHDWESFKNFVLENSNSFALPLTAVVADINNLSVVNSVGGHVRGDQMLKGFANVLREIFPKDSYFVRGEEASLVVLCYKMSRETVDQNMALIKSKFGGNFLYAQEMVTESKPNILSAIEGALKTLRQKKLVDRDSKHSEILNSLMKTLQACDPETEARSKRLLKMSSELGARLNLTDKQQSDLELLCMIHDIGKIGIPAEILNKKDSLTRDEWKIVQSHVEKGCQIAKSSKELSGIAEFVRSHHERWDGKGYPDGLSRESIPYLSRILSVMVAYDAMTSERPYRPALSKEVAVKELMACTATQFDPTVIAEFLQIVKQDDSEIDTESVDENDKNALSEYAPSASAMASMKVLMQEIDEGVPHVHKIKYSRYILDGKNRIVSVDDNFELMTGYSREDIREKNLSQGDLIPPEDLTEYLCLTQETLANSQMAYFEHRLRCKNGSMIYVFCMGKIFYDSASRETRSEIIIHDSVNTYAMRVMTNDEMQKSEKQLRRWEDTYRKDALTGLLNRSAFQSDVEEKLLDESTKVMLLMIDVDKFKNYNDTYGHRAGDDFLTFVARAIQGALRGSDLACRMGGDEFAAALFFKQDSETTFMYQRAQQIFDKISITVQTFEHTTGLSMGAVVAERSGMTFKQIYEASDSALYKSKENGRGRLSVG